MAKTKDKPTTVELLQKPEKKSVGTMDVGSGAGSTVSSRRVELVVVEYFGPFKAEDARRGLEEHLTAQYGMILSVSYEDNMEDADYVSAIVTFDTARLSVDVSQRECSSAVQFLGVAVYCGLSKLT